ncbi:MAG TPA: Lpg1974 family pore-forming outer membrane protein [Rhabdochlamydiaceae bacterium]|nr:Lpg1974 family pore-forming outer membrane protein [Rhabdochlamydiaceae bacterium]
MVRPNDCLILQTASVFFLIITGSIYPKNFENGEFDKKASQNSDLERVTIAQEQGASEDQNFEVKPTQSKTNFPSSLGIDAEDGLPNLSIRPQEQYKSVDIFVDALYWHTGETLDWAFTLTNSPNFEKSEFKTFSFDWDPGFRVGVGYNLNHDEWDTQLTYTWFQSKTRDHASGSVTSNSLAARLSLLEPFSTGKASLKVRYNIFDWDLGRSFLVSDYLFFRPFIGVKGGWINQIFSSEWTIINFLGTLPLIATDKMQNRFQGAGPKGGVSGNWCFGNIQTHCFSISGMFEAGYLWGHWTIRDKFIDSLFTTIYVKPTNRNFGSLVLHAFLGLGWDCNFDHCRSHFSAKIGYEIEDWFNQLQIYTDIAGSQNNDLILQGLSARVYFDF